MAARSIRKIWLKDSDNDWSEFEVLEEQFQNSDRILVLESGEHWIRITPQGIKTLETEKQVYDNYQISEIEPKDFMVRNPEIIPRDMMTEIGLYLSFPDLKNLCLSSMQFASLCSESNTFFWNQKLNFDFPDRIQKESLQLGAKGYYEWLWKAHNGYIVPKRKFCVLTNINVGDRISLPLDLFSNKSRSIRGKYFDRTSKTTTVKVTDYDRFFLYPEYFLSVQRGNLPSVNLQLLSVQNKNYKPEFVIFNQETNFGHPMTLDFIPVVEGNFYFEYSNSLPVWDLRGIIDKYSTKVYDFYKDVALNVELSKTNVLDSSMSLDSLKILNRRMLIKNPIVASLRSDSFIVSSRYNKEPGIDIDIYLDRSFKAVVGWGSRKKDVSITPEEDQKFKNLVRQTELEFPEFYGRIDRWYREEFWNKLIGLDKKQVIQRLKDLGWKWE